MSTGVTNEEEPLESVTGARRRGRGGGGGGRILCLPSFILSGSPVYFFLPSSPTWIVEGWLAKVGPAKHKLGILKFPVERSYFSPSIFIFFFLSLSIRSFAFEICLPFLPYFNDSLREVPRLIFKQVREDFETLSSLDLFWLLESRWKIWKKGRFVSFWWFLSFRRRIVISLLISRFRIKTRNKLTIIIYLFR